MTSLFENGFGGVAGEWATDGIRRDHADASVPRDRARRLSAGADHAHEWHRNVRPTHRFKRRARGARRHQNRARLVHHEARDDAFPQERHFFQWTVAVRNVRRIGEVNDVDLVHERAQRAEDGETTEP